MPRQDALQAAPPHQRQGSGPVPALRGGDGARRLAEGRCLATRIFPPRVEATGTGTSRTTSTLTSRYHSTHSLTLLTHTLRHGQRCPWGGVLAPVPTVNELFLLPSLCFPPIHLSSFYLLSFVIYLPLPSSLFRLFTIILSSLLAPSNSAFHLSQAFWIWGGRQGEIKPSLGHKMLKKT